MEKQCNKCGELKPLSKFSKDKSKKGGIRTTCKDCDAIVGRAYRQNNKEHLREKNRRWRKENPEASNAIYARYRATEKRRKVAREWASNDRKENPEKSREYQRKYQSEQRASNIQYVLAKRLRERLRVKVKGLTKSGSAVGDLGCTLEELKVYLGAMFRPGMTWGKVMSQEIHIDHIVPLSSFDLTDREQLIKACHYTNLQPLWAEENLRKHNKTQGEWLSS